MEKIINNLLGIVFLFLILPMLYLGSFEMVKNFPIYNKIIVNLYLFLFFWNLYYVIRDWKKSNVPEEECPRLVFKIPVGVSDPSKVEQTMQDAITHLNNKKTLGFGCDDSK